jgi:ribose 5-phosphate isomerase
MNPEDALAQVLEEELQGLGQELKVDSQELRAYIGSKILQLSQLTTSSHYAYLAEIAGKDVITMSTLKAIDAADETDQRVFNIIAGTLRVLGLAAAA